MLIFNRTLVGGILVFGSMAIDPVHASTLKPEPGQLDLNIIDLVGIMTPASFTAVRENNLLGTDLRLRDLGVDTVQVPTLEASYWITARNAVSVSLRYFYAHGNATLSQPATINGAIIAPNQALTTDPFWVSAALFYERRLTPAHPALDLRFGVGLEYTYLFFRINGGQAPLTPTSPGSETQEDFYRQELPLPTLKVEALYPASAHWIVDSSLQGNWINHWNSQRQEGGTVWLSQSGFEAHLRGLYINSRYKNVEPEIGIFFFYYRQYENSNEDGNLFSASLYGPEIGLRWSSR